MRILVTGSRTWTDKECVFTALDTVSKGNKDIVVIHGGAIGVDEIAGEWADKNNALIVIYYADWSRYGKSAGPRRNMAMIEAGADICLAFIKNKSRGAMHCANAAEKAGIQVRKYEE